MYRGAMQKLAEVLHKRFLGLYRMLPMHVIAALLRGSGGTLTSESAVAFLPEVLDALRKAGRNMKSLDSMTPAQVFEEGKRQLLRLGAVRLRSGALAVRKGTTARRPSQK
jgi:hypothetical protein